MLNLRSGEWGDVTLRGLAGVLMLSVAVRVAPAAPPDDETHRALVAAVDFPRDIKPIFEARCANCHMNGAHKGGFQMNSRDEFLKGGRTGPGAVSGDSSKSLVIDLVIGKDPDMVMPIKGDRLTEAEVTLLRRWIDQGLPWEPTRAKYVAPLALRKPDVPAAEGSGLTNPIDLFLRDVVIKGKTVDDRAFVRRVHLDTLGLLPTPEAVEAFVADTAPDKRAALVRRLLDDRRNYAEHWLSFWNDLLRNDYAGTGYIDGGRQQITAWLYNALYDNLPYDQFVTQLVNPNPDSAGFIKGIVWRGEVNASQVPAMQAAQNVGQVFLGINLKCASCHDSFIDDWKLQDAYSLAAVFADKPLEIARCDTPTGRQATPGFLYPNAASIDPQAARPERLTQLAQALTQSDARGRVARTVVNRLWTVLMGRGFTDSPDHMDVEPWHAELLEFLAWDFVEHEHDLKRTLGLILTSRAYQLAGVGAPERDSDYAFAGPLIRRLSAEQFYDAVVDLTDANPGKPRFNPGRPSEEGAAVRKKPRASLLASNTLMTAMGRPNREQVVTQRSTVATTLECLELTNGSELDRMLTHGAKHWHGQGLTRDELLDRLYARALSRQPTPGERALAALVLPDQPDAQAISDLLWAMVMLPEFQLIP